MVGWLLKMKLVLIDVWKVVVESNMYNGSARKLVVD